jgi:hypothetical protein
MVRAIIEGRKTQTRRVVKPQPSLDGSRSVWHWKGAAWDSCPGLVNNTPPVHLCPYGVPGDRLWVRETWQPIWAEENNPPTSLKCHEGWNIGYPATDGVQEYLDHGEDLTSACRPSIFMPRWASRILLEVTDVRVQRVQEISFPDCRAEGMSQSYVERVEPCCLDCDGFHRGEKYAFRQIWNQINAKRVFGWSVNPWVWAVSFKVLEVIHD